MWSMFLKYLQIVGEAVTMLLAILFTALMIWGGKIDIHINSFFEILKKW